MLAAGITRARVLEFMIAAVLHSVVAAAAVAINRSASEAATNVLVMFLVNCIGVYAAYVSEKRARSMLLVDYQLALANDASRRYGTPPGAEPTYMNTCGRACAAEHVIAANAEAMASKASLQRYEAGIAYICHEVARALVCAARGWRSQLHHSPTTPAPAAPEPAPRDVRLRLAARFRHVRRRGRSGRA